jgi:predicted flap endonuclease-1-like 5' DNA nuclease
MEPLRSALSEREIEVTRLEAARRAMAQEKEAEIRQLQAKLAELEPLKTGVRERDGEIRRLQERHEAETRENRERLQALQSRSGEIESLKNALAQRDAAIQRLQRQGDQASSDAAAEAQRLKTRAAELAALVSERKERIKALEPLAAAAAARKPKPRPRRKASLFKTPKVRDDLKTISGIGPVLEKTLNRLGIASYAQIARFTRKDIERVAAALNSFPDRILRDDWVGGAKNEYRRKYGKKNRRR